MLQKKVSSGGENSQFRGNLHCTQPQRERGVGAERFKRKRLCAMTSCPDDGLVRESNHGVSQETYLTKKNSRGCLRLLVLNVRGEGVCVCVQDHDWETHRDN